MPRRWLTSCMLILILCASMAIGCRAPYPTYNPYGGWYGNPCVNPPPTGSYNPTTGRYDPYYNQNQGVAPNPYGYPYPQGYPPSQPPVGGSTSKREWGPTASNNGVTKAEFVANESTDSQSNRGNDLKWTSVGGSAGQGDGNRDETTDREPSNANTVSILASDSQPKLDTASGYSSGSDSMRVAGRFDGFQRN